MLLISRIVAGLATESSVAQAYIADVTSEEDRAKGMGKVGAAVGAGFIVGPAIGGLLSVYGFSVPGYAATILAVINFIFVWSFLPEPIHVQSKEKKVRRNDNLLKRIFIAFRKPLIGYSLLIFFMVTLAFSTIPVIVPLLSISFFNFGSIETSYLFIYIGLIQIIFQGFLIAKFVEKIGEEKLITLGPLLMTVGMIMMPLIPRIVSFGLTLAMIALANGVNQTIIPSFLSKRTSNEEQGEILGITQSISSIARIPGPLISGFFFELFGLTAPFFLSSLLLIIAFILSCKVFQACKVR